MDILRGMRIALWGLIVIVAACGDNLKSNVPKDAAPDDAPALTCGNGTVEGTEQCDDGDANGTANARCTTQCTWVCTDDSWCTDNEPCNGTETCVDHACVPGTPADDGDSCGDGKLCRNQVCSDAACGDTFVTGPDEECDDANSTPGDGCENDCKFSCLSTDSARDCTPQDACQGQGTCDDSTHTCTPGIPLDNNTPCGSGGYCKNGTCTQPTCGNGQTEPGEDCDLGATNGTVGSGCKADCTYECVVPANDCPAAPVCQKPSCNAQHACENVADATKNDMSCGTDLVCSNGACVAPTAVCGNGTIETGEQCDFGNGNGANTGCESNCQFSCTILPDSCNDGNPCNGTETCTTVTVDAKPGQKCTATAAPPLGTSCGTGKICLGQLCVSSTCGDNFVDADASEECDPPNGTTCSATCKNVVCGDGVRAGAEQCDDGNTTNLDGCDSACRFEQCHRVNSLSIGLPPNNLTTTFCPKNALGSAITGSLAQGQISDALSGGVKDGSITISLKAFGLDDLTGTADPSLALGVLTGSPVTGTTTYDGTADLDWWYTTAATVIDAMRNPTTMLAATIAAKVINAGPSNITITISLAGTPATLDMLRAKLRGNIGNPNKPLVSTGGTPGHLPSENLDPALQSFATVTGGELCGDVTAASLAAVAAPSALVGCGFLSCSQCYTAQNTLLDIIVSGCNIAFTQQIKATQPDAARVVGDVYKLTVGTGRRVTGCTKNGQPAALADCLADAAYSSFFRFSTDRVIAK
jgi:cysteine-rich repeat protein